jgi:hypothetical protein
LKDLTIGGGVIVVFFFSSFVETSFFSLLSLFLSILVEKELLGAFVLRRSSKT